MAAIVIPIPNEEGNDVPKVTRNSNPFILSLLALLSVGHCEKKRKVIHSVKFGVATVIVSLLYQFDPVYKQFRENAMWAIMTVVVMFEFSAGATVSKGLNRGAGTIVGGGLGCVVAGLAHEFGGVGNDIVISVSVFIFGAAATYTRMVPSIKKRYDYGFMIFLLTFNLVVVSGTRANEVMELARKRLSTIVMGFIVSIFTNLLIYPMWASDELHCNLASEFSNLASCIEALFEDYFHLSSEEKCMQDKTIDGYKMVLYSKSKDESLANFASWEPWHGRFGISYPWGKYLQIGDVLRELKAMTLTLRACLGATAETSSNLQNSIKEPCAKVGASVAWTLRELGDSITRMRQCQPETMLKAKLQSGKLELSQVMPQLKTAEVENSEGFQIASIVFLLMHIVDKVEVLTKAVDELGGVAHFSSK